MTVVVDERGQVLRTSEGDNLVSGGPFQRSVGGRPTIATSSMPFGTHGIQHLQMLSGRSVSFTDIYRTQPYVASAVNALAKQISRLPLKVYRRNSQGERERVNDHRLVDLIRAPAPRCSASQLKQWMAIPMLLHGNSALVKTRRERVGPPNRLWPLDWRYLNAHVVHSQIEFWRSTEFGSTVRLDPEDIVHFGWEAPDGRIGVSPLQQLGVTVRIEKSAQEYQESYLQHGFRPPAGIKLPEGVGIDKEVRQELREDIVQNYGGAANAALPVLLPNGYELVTVAHNAHEAELIEQRKLTREEVAAVYSVPQPLMGILDHATYSNVAELHRMLYTTVLGPWLTLFEETFKAQVIDPEPAFAGLFVEFELAEVLKGDKLKEIAALKMAVQSGLLTINEAREVQNRPRFDAAWCDQPLIPANNLRSAPEPEQSESELRELAASGRNGNH